MIIGFGGAALLLLSELSLVISLSTPLVLTSVLVSWFIPHSQGPPLKTEGSCLVQGRYSRLLYGLLGFSSWKTAQKKGIWATGDSHFNGCVALAPSKSYLFRQVMCMDIHIGKFEKVIIFNTLCCLYGTFTWTFTCANNSHRVWCKCTFRVSLIFSPLTSGAELLSQINIQYAGEWQQNDCKEPPHKKESSATLPALS